MAEVVNRKRLFFAIWPGSKVRERLARSRSLYCPRIGRWVAAENLHITLVFLGNVEVPRIESIETVSSQVHMKRFEITLDRMHAASRKGMVWLAPCVVPKELQELAAELKVVLAGLNVKVEERDYRPHVTIIRNLPVRIETREIEPVRWPVDSFALIESRHLHGASVYSPVRSWPLLV